MPTYTVQRKTVDHARDLIKSGKVEEDRRDDWSEDAASTDAANRYIEQHGMDEYAKWHLAVDDDEDKDNKGAYAFPIGDFKKVHRGAVIAAKVRAAQYHHSNVTKAADELLSLIDKDEK